MTKHLPVLLLLTIVFAFSSCKDDEDEETLLRPTLTTLEATSIGNTEATLGGIITDIGSGIESRGVCYGTTPDPTIDGSNIQGISGISAGEFSRSVIFLTAGTEYNVRAYAQQSDGYVAYGQNVTFMTTGGLSFSNETAGAATTTTIEVSTSFGSGGVGVEERGWVYSTSPSPTIEEDAVVDNWGLTITYENTLDGLQPDTEYFIRPFAESNTNTFLYGEELVVRTAGFAGPGGGVVLYDKGVMTGGWRYLEADITPTSMRQWGCQGNIVNGTSGEIGSGATNTVTIYNDCSQLGIAAEYCQELVSGGQSDWFLPSYGSLEVLIPSLYFLGTAPVENSYWSSSEDSFDTAFAVNNSNGSTTLIFSSKSSSRTVLPVRRY